MSVQNLKTQSGAVISLQHRIDDFGLALYVLDIEGKEIIIPITAEELKWLRLMIDEKLLLGEAK